jgi:hypothetical protein
MRLTPSDTVDHIDLNRSFRRPSSSHEERIPQKESAAGKLLREFCLGSIFDFSTESAQSGDPEMLLVEVFGITADIQVAAARQCIGGFVSPMASGR